MGYHEHVATQQCRAWREVWMSELLAQLAIEWLASHFGSIQTIT